MNHPFSAVVTSPARRKPAIAKPAPKKAQAPSQAQTQALKSLIREIAQEVFGSRLTAAPFFDAISALASWQTDEKAYPPAKAVVIVYSPRKGDTSSGDTQKLKTALLRSSVIADGKKIRLSRVRIETWISADRPLERSILVSPLETREVN